MSRGGQRGTGDSASTDTRTVSFTPPRAVRCVSSEFSAVRLTPAWAGNCAPIVGRLVAIRGRHRIGIDREGLAIVTAREEVLDHVHFVRAGLRAFEPENDYDAVHARVTF